MFLRHSCFLLLICFLGTMLTGCTSLNTYFPALDAPKRIKAGKTDFRLAFNQMVGRSLSPVFRMVKMPNGRLKNAIGLREHLTDTLEPLDIVLVRSRSALSRFGIPSHLHQLNGRPNLHPSPRINAPQSLAAASIYLRLNVSSVPSINTPELNK